MIELYSNYDTARIHCNYFYYSSVFPYIYTRTNIPTNQSNEKV